MSRKILVGFVAVAMGLFVLGCEQSEEPAVPPPPANSPEPQTQTPGAALSEMADDATAQVKQAAADASQTMAALTAEAQKLLDQAMQYIGENKMQLAEEALNKLDEMKARLPAEWAARIEQARKAFDGAKAAAGAIPAGIGG